MSTVEARTRGYKKRARTRSTLLAAAIEVIGERGEAFSISDVVERAGVSNGTFYNYFDDRDRLIDGVAVEVLTRFAGDSAAGFGATDPAVRFATITAWVLRRASEMSAEMQALLRLEVLQRAALGEGPLRYLSADLAAGIRTGRFDVAREDAALDVIVGGILMSVRRVVDSGADFERDRAIIEHLLRSLGIEGAEAARLAAGAVAPDGVVRG